MFTLGWSAAPQMAAPSASGIGQVGFIAIERLHEDVRTLARGALARLTQQLDVEVAFEVRAGLIRRKVGEDRRASPHRYGNHAHQPQFAGQGQQALKTLHARGAVLFGDTQQIVFIAGANGAGLHAAIAERLLDLRQPLRQVAVHQFYAFKAEPL